MDLDLKKARAIVDDIIRGVDRAGIVHKDSVVLAQALSHVIDALTRFRMQALLVGVETPMPSPNSVVGEPPDPLAAEFKKRMEILDSVHFLRKAEEQKDDCLACGEPPATLMAVYKSAQIRCCSAANCKSYAAALALRAGSALEAGAVDDACARCHRSPCGCNGDHPTRNLDAARTSFMEAALQTFAPPVIPPEHNNDPQWLWRFAAEMWQVVAEDGENSKIGRGITVPMHAINGLLMAPRVYYRACTLWVHQGQVFAILRGWGAPGDKIDWNRLRTYRWSGQEWAAYEGPLLDHLKKTSDAGVTTVQAWSE